MTPLERSINGLRLQSPEMSAHRTLSPTQTWIAAIGLALLAAAVAADARRTLIVLFGLATALYLLSLAYRLYLLRTALHGVATASISDEDARGLADQDLPIYTLLVPVYREARVVARTIEALEALDYPRDRLDIKLLLEVDDEETIDAARALRSELRLEIVLVPAEGPRTKPKACNYGLALARGELVTIYDAEDHPEPLQLRRAVAAFRELPPTVACLQARLSYFNPEQNMITRWFTAEYDAWFSMLLPALAHHGGPVPLGGTSMHIKRRTLDRIGGWDAYNVTEDADLGVRLQRLGYGVQVLDSLTLEEANSDFVNWVKQRSRWYKGYLQTWLVHMRNPRRLVRELGWRRFIGLTFAIGSVPVLALINPVFWAATWLWILGASGVVASLLPPVVYYPGLACLVVGNFVGIYIGLLGIRVTGRPRLLGAVLLFPLYWLMMSIAAIRALLQLTVAPSFWEKSVHGLDRRDDSKRTEVAVS